jgi:hypothetical protein
MLRVRDLRPPEAEVRDNQVVEKNPAGCLSEFISRCFGVGFAVLTEAELRDNQAVEKNPAGCLSEFISRCFGVGDLQSSRGRAFGIIKLLRKTLRAACQNLFPDASVWRFVLQRQSFGIIKLLRKTLWVACQNLFPDASVSGLVLTEAEVVG